MKTRTKSIKDNLTILQNSKPRKKSYQSKIDQKPKPNQSILKQPPKSINKESDDIKKYLQKTLTILSHRFNSKAEQRKVNASSVLNMSQSIYKIVRQNLSSIKRLQQEQKQNICPNNILTKGICSQFYSSKIKDDILKESFKNSSSKNNRESRKIIVSEKNNVRQRAASAIDHYSSILQASQICPREIDAADKSRDNAIDKSRDQEAIDKSLFVKKRSNSTLDSYFREKFGTNAEDEQAVQKKLRVIKALKKSQEIVNKSNRSHVQSSMILTNCDINEKSVVMEKLKSKNSERLKQN